MSPIYLWSYQTHLISPSFEVGCGGATLTPAEGDRGRRIFEFGASLIYRNGEFHDYTKGVDEDDNHKEHSGSNKLTKGRKAPTTNPDSLDSVHRNTVLGGNS